MKYPPVSILILNYNGVMHLKSCLPSLERLNYPPGKLEFIVVDNASKDGSIEYLRSYHRRIRITENASNLGFTEAYNRAIPGAKHELVLVLNNDIKVEPGFLAPLVAALEQDKRLAMVVPKLYDFYHKGILGGAGMVCDIFGLAFNRGIQQPDKKQYDDQLYLPYGCAAAALMRKSLFQKAGGFDGRYFIYHEDVDFAWRCRLLGYAIKYVPASVAYHRHMATMSRETRGRNMFTWEKNRVCTLLKNYSLLTLLFILPCLFLLKLLHLAYALATGRPGEAWGVIRAYCWNLANLPETLRLRRKAQKLRRVSDFEIMKRFKKYSIEIGLGIGVIKHPITKG